MLQSADHARYRIVDSLGRGGMGEVCLADDLMLDRQVALKFLASVHESDAVARLLAEARAAAALHHPFICAIYEVTTLHGRPCIAMEYVRGETLERRLRRGPLPLGEALDIADEIAEALDAAHKRRVIHGDLKPANVMLTDDRHVKVMDFGLATRLPLGSDDATVWARTRPDDDAAVVRGTPAYMAPEQIRGEGVDRRADLFAFGILLYELLSGDNPFRRASVDATLAAILGDPIVDLADRVRGVPPDLAALVTRLLAKAPSDRMQSFGDVRTCVRRVAAGLEIRLPQPSGPRVAERKANRGGTGLIGRDAEKAQLLEALGRAREGRGGALVLKGEAGVGKTKLAEEALENARLLGCRTFVGRCSDQAGTPALLPYIEVLETASRVMSPADFCRAVGPSAPELATLLPELHRLFPRMELPLELPPQLRQRYLFANIQQVVARCSQITPLVVFIDDLQWADESSLRLTQQLVAHAGELSVLLIVACRDVEAPRDSPKRPLRSLFGRLRAQRRDAVSTEALNAALSDLTTRGLAHAITLRPFAEREMRAMLAMLGRREPPPSVVRRFLEHTGGNPFFAAELFRHLKDEGGLFDAGENWRRDAFLDDVDVPESVRVVLERRSRHVSEGTKTVLRVAAVIGTEFDLELLEDVAGVHGGVLAGVLEEAEGARLLKGPAGRHDVTWRFAHHLIRTTLVSALPRIRRQELHLRVADAMQRRDRPLNRYLSAVAYHLYNAGSLADPTRTARALMTAAESAYAVYATEDAIQHFRRALDVLQRETRQTHTDVRQQGGLTDEIVRRRVQEQLADLLALSGNRNGAMEHYRALMNTPGQHDGLRARIQRKIGALYWQAGDREEAMACYERALEALGGERETLEAAHVYQELGLAAFRSGDNQKAIKWAELALQCAEKARSAAEPSAQTNKEATTAIAHATNTIGVACARAGDVERAREQVERSMTVARDIGLLDVACRAYANLGVLYSALEPRRAIDVTLAGLELASTIGAASLQSYMYANLAAAYCALTDRCDTEGLQAAEAAAALDRELGQLDHLAVPLIVKAQIHQCRGELQMALDAYREALAIAERIGEPQLVLPCYDGLATISLDRGDRVSATQYMRRAQVLCERTGLDLDTLLLLPFLC